MNVQPQKSNRSSPLVVKKTFTFGEPPEKMVLDSGADLGPVTIAYETLGRLREDKGNAILILHACTGDSHVAGVYDPADPRPGWWDNKVGPGKSIDTDRFFVICANIPGSCMGSTGPSSINPETDTWYGLDFPMVTIRDMVRAQKRLLDHLGISKIMAAIGGSVGGMQVLQWCATYPGMIKSAIPLATTTRHSAQAIAFNEVARQAIMADPNWRGGNYYDGEKPQLGLAVARMIGHVTYLSDESMREKFGRRLQNGEENFSFDFSGDFQVESYLRYQGSKFVDRFDANSLLYITKAGDYFDLMRDSEELLNPAASRIKFLVISFTSDWLYPTYQSKELVSTLKKSGLDVSFCEIEAQWGHDAFLLPNERLGEILRGFLQRIDRDD